MTRTTLATAIAVGLLAIAMVAFTLGYISPWREEVQPSAPPHVVLPVTPVTPEEMVPPQRVVPPANVESPPPAAPEESEHTPPRIEQVMTVPEEPVTVPLEVAKEELRKKVEAIERDLQEAKQALNDLDLGE